MTLDEIRKISQESNVDKMWLEEALIFAVAAIDDFANGRFYLEHRVVVLEAAAREAADVIDRLHLAIARDMMHGDEDESWEPFETLVKTMDEAKAAGTALRAALEAQS